MIRVIVGGTARVDRVFVHKQEEGCHPAVLQDCRSLRTRKKPDGDSQSIRLRTYGAQKNIWGLSKRHENGQR